MSRRVPGVLLALAGLLGLYLVLPFAAGLQQAGGADWQGADTGALGRACLVSAGSATLATLAMAACGIPLGYVLARAPGRLTAALGFIVQFPLALPPLASGVLLLFLVGPYAPLGSLLGGVTDTFWGIVLAQIFVAAPFAIIAARSAFAGVDPVLEDVAATLGHGRQARFWRVSLPLAWRACLAGLLLAWLRGFGEFGATVMVAYHPYSLPVYTYVAFGAQGLPAMLPVLVPTLAVAVGVMGLSLLVGRSGRAAVQAAGRSGAAAAPPLAHAASLPPSRAARGSGGLAFRFDKQLGSFRLQAAWAPDGRRLGILGPSGSGKSLTLRLLAGLETAEAGFLRLEGCDWWGRPPEARALAYVPQGYGLLPDRTVLRQILFASGATPADAAFWIARLGLSGLESRRPHELSLGQQQRVALGRALARPAGLVLLDEPFSALDAPLRARLRRELRDLQRSLSAVTVLVTHDPEEALLLADELLVLDGGRVLQAGPAAEIASRPAGAQVARLLGFDLLEGTAAAGGRIVLEGGAGLACAAGLFQPGEPLVWSVRRESVRLRAGGAYGGEIEEVRPVAGAAEASIRFGAVRLRALVMPGEAVLPGPCRFDICPDRVHVWPRPQPAAA